MTYTTTSGGTDKATKVLTVASLATITTGISMVERFEGVPEAFEWVLGHPVWTHEMPRMMEPAKKLILAQFPEMPSQATGENWRQIRDAAIARYGESVEVRRGGEQRSADLLSSLSEMLS